MAKIKLFKKKEEGPKEEKEMFLVLYTRKCLNKLKSQMSQETFEVRRQMMEYYKNDIDLQIADVLDDIYEGELPDDIPTIKLITLDDEFLSWLTDNHLEYSDDALSKYASEMTEEKATELLRKNEFDGTFSVYTIPLLIAIPEAKIKEPASFSLTDLQRHKFEEYLKEIFPKSEVYAFEYILPESGIENYEDLQDIGATGIRNHVHIRKDIYKDPIICDIIDDSDGMYKAVLFLPFVLAQKLKSAFVDTSDWFDRSPVTDPDDCPNFVYLTREMADGVENAILPKKFAEDAGIYQMLQKEVFDDILCAPFMVPVPAEEYDEFMDIFYDSVKYMPD